jgi:hypothetical protein
MAADAMVWLMFYAGMDAWNGWCQSWRHFFWYAINRGIRR